MTDVLRSILRDPNATTLTFDCYGTLIDWEAGACEALRRIYGYSTTAFTDDILIDVFLAADARIVRGNLFPYTQALQAVAREIAQTLVGESDPAQEAAFANSVPAWPPFEETNWALNELSQRFKLAIVSNIDDHLISQTITQFDVRFEQIVTSEQSKCYKPDIRIFEEALRQLGEKASSVVHIAEGLCEAEPTRRLGVNSIWVRRSARSDDGSKATADATVSSLSEVVEALS